MTINAPIMEKCKNAGLGLVRLMRKYKKTTIAIWLIIFLIILGIVLASQPEKPEYLTTTAVRGDLEQVVEAVGEVISERDLLLQFPITGVVEEVNVEEGDSVEAGQELARLRSSGLAADVQSARGQVQSAQADLSKALEGTRPEEIAVTEASVENKRSSLAAAQESLRSSERNLELAEQELTVLEQEAETSLAGFVTTARSDALQHLSTALTSARVMDGVLEDTDLLDVLIKHEPHQFEAIQQQLDVQQPAIQLQLDASRIVRDYRDAIAVLESARATLSDFSYFLTESYGIVSSLPITPAYSNADREDTKSDIAVERSSVQSALSAVDTALKNLRDASAGFDTRIATKQASVTSLQGTKDRALADIQTFETSLRIEQAQLDLKKAGSRPADITAARGRLNQAYAQLQRAEERYRDTVITAPISGRITQVNLKEGELLSTSFASDAAIRMLGDAPFRVEMFVSEIDIPKVALYQSGSIALDAFPGKDIALVVNEVDPAATEVDGVSKYRVKLDFTKSYDRLKIGMTGDSQIQTDFRENVIQIPGRAVLTRPDGTEYIRILHTDETVTESDVQVGIDGAGGDVEILSGVDEGQEVIVLEKKN